MKRPSFFYAVLEAPSGSSGSTAASDTITPDNGFDPSTYEAPDVGAIDKFIESEGRGEAPLGKNAGAKPAEEKKEVEKPVEKPADEKKPEEKKPDQQKEPPAAQLRNRLRELEGERDKLNAALEAAKGDKRVEELTAKLAEKEAAIAEKEKAVASVQRQLEAHNPLVSKRLTEMSKKLNADLEPTFEMVPDLERDYKGLIEEFESLPRGKEGYAEKLREFRDRLRDKFGDDAQTAFDAVRKGVQFRVEYGAAAAQIQADAAGAIFSEQREQWQKGNTRIEQDFAKWFEPPADAETTDPYNANLFLKKFREQMPADAVKEMDTNLKGWVSRVFNGVQPRSKSDFPGMSDAQIQQEMSKIEERTKAEREDAPRIAAVAVQALWMMRPVIAEYQKLKQRVEAIGEAQPPDPTRKDGQRPADDQTVDDFKFKSPEEIEREIANA